jgi:glycosyltransferase involved in cell wall biosynthesis/predicted metal-dependent phosphoesterase TrpH
MHDQPNAAGATTTSATSRADLHCHSTASQLSKLGVQRALGLPECATPPQEVYALAKRRGMDFVTITDHDTIAGALEIADRPDVFISEELTCEFAGEPQAVHVLVYDITPEQHEWLQAHRGDVEKVAEHLREHDIACALAHPFYAVEAPLLPRHRRRLAELFGVWEVRNGSRAPELNAPAAVYVETHGGVGVGGSDDHAGVDIGRTWTETPPAATPRELLDHVRAGRCAAGGEQGSAAKWAHSAMALAVRALGTSASSGPADPQAVLCMAERVMREGDARRGAMGADLGPDDARNLLRAWLHAVDLAELGEDGLLELLQRDDFAHADLFRRARRAHERKLTAAVRAAVGGLEAGESPQGVAAGVFDACVAAVPYAPAAAFLGREKAKLARRDGDRLRVALVADAIGAVHGVTHAIEQVRERGVPGFDVEVIGTDRNVDRRLSAVAEVDVPFYPGLQIGVPSLPAVVETIAEGRYDLVHVASPGPAGLAALLVARATDRPLVASHHTELAAYAGLRSGDAGLEALATMGLAAFYAQAHRVLSPSGASDRALERLGVPAARIGRWDRGVDTRRFSPANRVAGLLPGEVNVLYAGRLTKEKGAALLAGAFLAAHARDPRLHLCLAGGGPEEEWLRERLGDRATFLGFLHGEELPRVYASADVFLFASRTDTFGQVVLEAQASGLPVVAVAEGGPAELVRDGVTGLLRPPDAQALAGAVTGLAGDPLRRERVARAALADVAERSWERALDRLAAGYHAAMSTAAGAEARRAA